MKDERSEITFGTTRIRYAIRRTDRVKTVALAVDPAGSVLVTAPRHAEPERLDRIVRQKAAWILARVRRQGDLPPPPGPREFVSGESFWYLGRQYRLRVEAQDGGEGAHLDHGRLVVRVGRGLAPEARRDRVRALLTGWYRTRAGERLPALVELWSPRVRVPPPKVAVVEQQRRWGSCTPAGAIRLNWRVIGAPARAIEYVVAHELVHLHHADHTPAFWRVLGRAMPDYEPRREALRRAGGQLTW